MARTHDIHKIRSTIGLTARQDAELSKEAARLGTAVSDLVRRIIDNWIDQRERNRPQEKVLVLDRETQTLRAAR